MSSVIHYPTFRLPHWFQGPDDLRQLLHELWSCRFPELYDSGGNDRPESSVDAAVNRILDRLWEGGTATGHRRFVSCGLAMGFAARPTMAKWDPKETISEAVIGTVDDFLNDRESIAQARWAGLFPHQYTGSQAYDEAIDVFLNLTRILDPAKAGASLLEIVDDCMQGYAVFPGSERRRDLFNWFLLEVVPAAWYLRAPEAIYAW